MKGGLTVSARDTARGISGRYLANIPFGGEEFRECTCTVTKMNRNGPTFSGRCDGPGGLGKGYRFSGLPESVFSRPHPAREEDGEQTLYTKELTEQELKDKGLIS